MRRDSAAQGGRIRVAVSGARGRMGGATCSAVLADEGTVLAAMIDPALAAEPALRLGEGTDPAAVRCFSRLEEALTGSSVDVVVDFTIPTAVKGNVFSCIDHGIATVVGTSGLDGNDLAEIAGRASEQGVPVLVVPNFALGAVMMMQFARQAAEHFDACEIVELHHEKKVDAPSGTARLTQQYIAEVWRAGGQNKEIPIHSVRLPGLVAHQEVIFGGLGETLTLRHDSLSRESFMPGVMLAIKRVRTLQGLVVGLEKII
jgi:4-hydroxy-tetrahydrodipicolinate reductase